jgi:hypothetical protein
VILVGAQKTRMVTGMRTVKTVLLRYTMETKTLLRIRLLVICVTFGQRTYLHFVHPLKTLREAEFKEDRLINLAEEISKHLNIQAMLWLLLAAFRQVYSENQEQQSKQKDLKNFQFGQNNL